MVGRGLDWGLQRPHLASPHCGEGPGTGGAEPGASSRKMGSVSAPVPLRLRPLEIGDVLDETFRMYRRHFLLLAGISVIFSVPLAALSGYGYFALFDYIASQATSSNPGDFSTFVPAMAPLAAGVLVNHAVLPLLYAALTYA